MTKRVRQGLPTREAIMAFIAASPTPVGKRDIARKFKVSPADRVALKGLIKEIERDGAVTRGQHRRLAAADALPSIAELEISAIDLDGEVKARPTGWPPERAAPDIFVLQNRLRADQVGNRAAPRLTRLQVARNHGRSGPLPPQAP